MTHSRPPRCQVTSGFKAKSMAAALPPPFLEPLFSISLMEENELRQLVLEILHNIIDRHDNRAKLRGIRYLEVQGNSVWWVEPLTDCVCLTGSSPTWQR